MKTRLFTLLFAFLGAIGLLAQPGDPGAWVTPPTGTYSHSVIVIAQLGYFGDNGVESVPQRGDKIAAFIDGECRGVFDQFTGNPPKDGLSYEPATLRIWGSAADVGKPVVFKFSAGGSVYTVQAQPNEMVGDAVQKLTFPASEVTYGNLSFPIVFEYSQPIEDVTLTLVEAEGNGITMRVGESIDLSQVLKINVYPAGAPLPENTFWNSGQHFTIDGNILTATHETLEAPTFIQYFYGQDKVATYQPLYILPATVPVVGVRLLSEEYVNVNRDASFDIEYDVLPDDATNQEVTFECTNPDALVFGVPELLNVRSGYKVNVVAKKKGKHQVTIKTVDGNYRAVLTVNVAVPIKSARFKDAEATYIVGEIYSLPEIILDPVDADFDPMYVKARLYQRPGEIGKPEVESSNWRIADEFYASDQFAFMPLVICEGAYLEAYIGGDEPCVQKVNFKKRYMYNQGWSWASVPYAYTFRVDEDPIKGLQEVRSEDKVAFNDMKFGWFGDDFIMEQGQAYKQYVGSGIVREVGYTTPVEGLELKQLRQGWNWIATPYEYEFIVDLLYKNVAANEGDIILSKENGMMTFTQGNWESSTQSLFGLRTGEGYLYYASTADSRIMWGKQFGMPQPQPETLNMMSTSQYSTPKLWEYDASRFASSMAIVGKLANAQGLDASQYTIGAFVGNECRGEGRILDNGLILVSLNGEAGENITFKLRNLFTDEEFDFKTQVNFNLLAGAVDHPIPFVLQMDMTGIEDINGEDLNIRFVGDELQVDGGFSYQVISADGKVVTGQQLSSGVYIVVVDTPNGKVSQKVVKK